MLGDLQIIITLSNGLGSGNSTDPKSEEVAAFPRLSPGYGAAVPFFFFPFFQPYLFFLLLGTPCSAMMVALASDLRYPYSFRLAFFFRADIAPIHEACVISFSSSSGT